MDLGRVILGVAGLVLGYNTFVTGAGHLSGGLKGKGRGGRGMGRAERDPGAAGGRGRRVGGMVNGKGRIEFRSVTTLDERINAIRDRARAGRGDPSVIAWARKQVTARCPEKPGGWCVPEKDKRAEAVAIFNAMRRHVRYTNDPVNLDLYVHPKRTLEHKAADCDDYTSLGAAALLAVGVPVKFRVIRTKNASAWDHIYLMANVAREGGREEWMALDASVPVKAGWEVPPSHVAAYRDFELAL